MTALIWLIPVALFLGLVGLRAFIWALKSGQFEDLEGAAYRILDDDTIIEDNANAKDNANDESIRDANTDASDDHHH